MSQRLPTPGSDNGTWGYVLNGFLGVAHDANGNLLGPAVSAAGGEMIANKNQASGYAGLDTNANVNIANLPTGITSTTVALGSDSRLVAASTAVQSVNGKSGTSVSLAASDVGAAQALTPTAVKTSAYTASAGDFIPVDASSGSVTITLPTAPADKSRVEIKMINTSGSNTATVTTGGSDVFNKSGGTTSGTLSLLNQALMLQYNASSAIWYVQSDDLPLAQLDTRYSKTGTLVYNVKDYGATGNGTTDDSTAIQATITAAGTIGGTVYLPPGSYLVNTAIAPANNIALIGSGIGNTVIYPGVGVAAINSVNSGTFTVSAPLTNFTLAHLTIDGTNQGSSGYNLAYKGVFCQFLSGCTFEDLVIRNCVATGLGIDFLTNGTVIHNVRAVGNGRLNQGGGSGAGSNGIGIGTGRYTIEDFVVSDCFASGNGRYGIMIELQLTGTPSKGMRIHDCYSTANFNHGFGDAGGSGAIWSHCIAYLNNSDGFSIDNGTVGATAQPSGGSVYMGCEALANSRYGFSYAPTASNGSSIAGAGNISFVGCKSWNNTSLGFNIQSLSGSPVSGIYITSCDIFGNGASGIQTNNPSNDVVISGCHIRSNGQSSSTSKNGINITNNITNLQITGCKIWDDGGTQKQAYGVAVTSGATLATGSIVNNDLRGNLTGTFTNAGTLTSMYIDGNVGYDGSTTAAGGPLSLTRIRRDTATDWTTTNPTLASGEPAYETDTRLLKIGDGATAWTSLNYAHPTYADQLYAQAVGAVAATLDGGAANATPGLVTGRLHLCLAHVASSTAINKMDVDIVSMSNAGSLSNTYMGIYLVSSGALLATTADFSSSITTIGTTYLIHQSLTSTVAALPVGTPIYLAILTTISTGSLTVVGARQFGTNQSAASGAGRLFSNTSGSTMTSLPGTLPALSQTLSSGSGFSLPFLAAYNA